MNRIGDPLRYSVQFLNNIISKTWTWILANDGAGSGLDADTLDGVEGSGYATSGHTHTLSGLSDVIITTPSDNQPLAYDSSSGTWINQTLSYTLSGLSDTTITSPSDGDLLVYDSGTSKWLNATGYRLQEAGDIIYTLDDTAPSGCLELDGSTITGGASTYPNVASRYSWMVSGSDLILPDFRGRFLRTWDNGAGTDPDAASRTARAGDGQTGDYPGTYQADEIIAHTHDVRYRSDLANGGSATAHWKSGSTSTGITLSQGGNETRPVNINVSAWMVMG